MGVREQSARRAMTRFARLWISRLAQPRWEPKTRLDFALAVAAKRHLAGAESNGKTKRRVVNTN